MFAELVIIQDPKSLKSGFKVKKEIRIEDSALPVRTLVEVLYLFNLTSDF
jgi:hypothetical protein